MIPKHIIEKAMTGLKGISYWDAEACLEASGLPERVRVLEDALRSIEPNSIVMGRIRDWLDPLGGALTTPEDELKALWNWASMVSHIASAALGTEKEKG
jgi:hypothetical protein